MLQINLVIEDAKISLDELQEEISEIEEYVQSTDVAGKFLLAHFTSLEATLTDQPCKSFKRTVLSLLLYWFESSSICQCI
jgi:hypothetical protein